MTKRDPLFWQNHIEGYKSSGILGAAYCTEHEVSLSSMHYHLKKSRALQDNAKFLPVKVATENPPLRIKLCGAEVLFDPNTEISLIADVTYHAGNCHAISR